MGRRGRKRARHYSTAERIGLVLSITVFAGGLMGVVLATLLEADPYDNLLRPGLLSTIDRILFVVTDGRSADGSHVLGIPSLVAMAVGVLGTGVLARRWGRRRSEQLARAAADRRTATASMRPSSMRTVASSRGFVILSKTWTAWAMFALVAGVGTQFFFLSPVGSLQHLPVALTLALYAVSLLAAMRTKIEVSPTELLLQGRLRRRRIDLSDVRRLEVVPNGDFWSLLVFLAPIGAMLWTVTLVRSDGSKQDLRSIIGSHEGCSDAVREMGGLLGLEIVTASAYR